MIHRMGPLEQAIKGLRSAVAEYDDYLGNRILSIFPDLTPVLRQIRGLVGTVDLDHLSDTPTERLNDITNAVKEATSCIKDYMLNSFPPEQQVPQGGGEVRPYALLRDSDRILFRRGQLTLVYGRLFDLVGPIVAQQQSRLSRIA